MAANAFLVDASTRHQVFLQRYGSGEAKTAKKTISSLRRQINARLSQEPTQFQTNRLNAVLNDIDQLSREAFGQIQNQVTASAKALVVDEAEFSVKLYDKTTAQVNFSQPSQASLIAAVEAAKMDTKVNSAITIDDALRSFSDAKAKEINQLISDSVVLGDTTPQISAKVNELVSTRLPRQAEALVRTVVNATSSEARQQVYEKNSELLDGYEWVATLDGATTLICGSRDGKIYPIGAGPMPPAHWNCRSTTVPAVNEAFTLAKGLKGQRASKGATGGKAISAKTNYGTWLKRQPKEFVDEALGVEKSALFRSGKLKIEQFVDPTGRVYTIAQLKSMNPFAFQEDTIKPKPKPIVKPKAPKAAAVPAASVRTIAPTPISVVARSEAKAGLQSIVDSGVSNGGYPLDPASGLPVIRMRSNRRQRGVRFDDQRRKVIGKVNVSTLTPEAASVVLTTTMDASKILGLYGIRDIRGVNMGTSNRAAASMGDGILNLSKDYFNTYAAHLNKSNIGQIPVIEAEMSRAITAIDAMGPEIARIKAQFGFRSDEYAQILEDRESLVKSYNRNRDKLYKISPREIPVESVSKWKVGDDPKRRPGTSGGYHATGEDRLRATVYHEVGHQVHQQFGAGNKLTYLSPPLESALDDLFRRRTVSPTIYSDTNSKEWFAENFSLYHMGRKELVDKLLIDLLDDMADGKFNKLIGAANG